MLLWCRPPLPGQEGARYFASSAPPPPPDQVGVVGGGALRPVLPPLRPPGAQQQHPRPPAPAPSPPPRTRPLHTPPSPGDGHPDGVDSVGVRSADRAGDGVDLSRADRVLIDGERQLRRAGTFAFAQARRREQEDYRP